MTSPRRKNASPNRKPDLTSKTKPASHPSHSVASKVAAALALPSASTADLGAPGRSKDDTDDTPEHHAAFQAMFRQYHMCPVNRMRLLIEDVLNFGTPPIRRDLKFEYTCDHLDRCCNCFASDDTFDVGFNDPEAAADMLGISPANIRRKKWDLRKVVSLLRQNPDRLAAFGMVINSPLMAALALIHPEKWFREHGLSRLDVDVSDYLCLDGPISDVTPVDAVLLSASCADCYREQEILMWMLHNRDDLTSAANESSFGDLTRDLIDDALTIAKDDPKLHRHLSKWLSRDCKSFLEHFLPLWNQRHFTWSVVFQANHDMMPPTLWAEDRCS